jgi:hypothetical protein
MESVPEAPTQSPDLWDHFGNIKRGILSDEMTNSGCLEGLAVPRYFSGDSLAVMAYSFIGEKKNDILLISRYSDAKIGEDKMVEITKLVEYVMTNGESDRIIHSAFDGLKQLNEGESIK